jgi:hypothetical protein
MCGKCHTDPSVVGKYGLSTEVLNTYVADFHGTTVTLFEKQHPEEQTNKPVCYDCHGIHDIARPDDPQKGLAVRKNLLVRCQECHPNATDNFPESWLSHYIPSPNKYPAVYYVNLFYMFFIPGVLGSMGLLVALDFSRSTINRVQQFARRRRTATSEEPAQSQVPAGVVEAPLSSEEELPQASDPGSPLAADEESQPESGARLPMDGDTGPSHDNTPSPDNDDTGEEPNRD